MLKREQMKELADISVELIKIQRALKFYSLPIINSVFKTKVIIMRERSIELMEKGVKIMDSDNERGDKRDYIL